MKETAAEPHALHGSGQHHLEVAELGGILHQLPWLVTINKLVGLHNVHNNNSTSIQRLQHDS